MSREQLAAMTDFDAPVPLDVFVVAVDDETRTYAFRLLEHLRNAGVAADADFEGRSLKAQMRSANRMKARFVAVVGPDEKKENKVSVKRLSDGTEAAVPFDDVAAHIKEN